MEIPSFLVLNIYTLFLSILSYFFVPKKKRKDKINIESNKIRITLVILIIADTFGRFSVTNNENILNYIIRFGNYLTFIIDPIFHIFMLKYIDSWMTKEIKEKKIWFNFMTGFVVINFVLSTLSEFSKNPRLIYYYDSNMIYHRGDLFITRAIFIIITMLLVELYTLIHIDNIENENKKVLLLYPMIPTVFWLIQATLIPTLALEYTGMYISCMIMSIFMQRKDISIDGLTGVLNRNIFNRILDNKINGRSMFSLIMIDLDYFKEINDTYGHVKGDEALIEIVKILKKSFRKNDLIARYGGDEFCVITDNTDKEELKNIIKRFQNEIDSFNKTKEKEYTLSASVGFNIYDNKKYKTQEEFINSVDQINYKEKKEKHKKLKKKQ